jgi:hypothetical protein
MLRRVLSVLRRPPALARCAFASAAALGLALACLNPQNDDLPSNADRGSANPDDSPGAGQGSLPPPANNNDPSPLPTQSPAEEAPPLAPTDAPEPSDTEDDGDDLIAPDAGVDPDAGTDVDPSVQP